MGQTKHGEFLNFFCLLHSTMWMVMFLADDQSSKKHSVCPTAMMGWTISRTVASSSYLLAAIQTKSLRGFSLAAGLAFEFRYLTCFFMIESFGFSSLVREMGCEVEMCRGLQHKR
jgi:hypothetical protein